MGKNNYFLHNGTERSEIFTWDRNFSYPHVSILDQIKSCAFNALVVKELTYVGLQVTLVLSDHGVMKTAK